MKKFILILLGFLAGIVLTFAVLSAASSETGDPTLENNEQILSPLAILERLF